VDRYSGSIVYVALKGFGARAWLTLALFSLILPAPHGRYVNFAELRCGLVD